MNDALPKSVIPPIQANDADRHDLCLWTAMAIGVLSVPAALIPILGLPLSTIGLLTAWSALKAIATLPKNQARDNRRVLAWVAIGLAALALAAAIVVLGLEIYYLSKGKQPRLRPWDYGKPNDQP